MSWVPLGMRLRSRYCWGASFAVMLTEKRFFGVPKGLSFSLVGGDRVPHQLRHGRGRLGLLLDDGLAPALLGRLLLLGLLDVEVDQLQATEGHLPVEVALAEHLLGGAGGGGVGAADLDFIALAQGGQGEEEAVDGLEPLGEEAQLAHVDGEHHGPEGRRGLEPVGGQLPVDQHAAHHGHQVRVGLEALGAELGVERVDEQGVQVEVLVTLVQQGRGFPEQREQPAEELGAVRVLRSLGEGLVHAGPEEAAVEVLLLEVGHVIAGAEEDLRLGGGGEGSEAEDECEESGSHRAKGITPGGGASRE
ncbi:hypothetical protein ACN28I_11525 [Archangium gephyra]|uniref:hypothetical protein n=1 Tax=Archangium gephyra TaxID=48 RepID=UPI003B7D5E9C